MRILFVTPYPPSRIRVRGYELLKKLSHQHEVTIITQVMSEQELADVEVLRKRGDEVIVVEESKRNALLRTGMALPGSTPLQVAYTRSWHFTKAVETLFAQRQYDVIHVEHLRGIGSMEPLIETHPFVWDAVDCISLLCKQTAAAGPSFPVRAVARLELKRTQRYEARMLSALSHAVVTSERDRASMIALLRIGQRDFASSDESLGADIRVVPNGVDLDYFHPMQLERRRFNLVFSGKMSYHANVATALYLYRQIMPLIWQQRPEATLTIVGSNPPGAIQALASDPRVEVTGYVHDMRDYVGRAEVMLSPMVYSVGIQNKVLEAMALGTPVVVASQPAEALNARAGRDMLVAQTAQEFADAALRLFNDAALRATLSECGQNYIKQHHNWWSIAGQFVEVYEQAIAAHRQRTSSSYRWGTATTKTLEPVQRSGD